MVLKAKYFLTHLFLLFTKKHSIKWVGQAQSKLKLFFVMLCTVPNHMKINITPRAPVQKNNKPSKPCKKLRAKLFLSKLVRAIITSNKLNITKGVKIVLVLLSSFIAYKF